MAARVSEVEDDKMLLLPGELVLECSEELNCVLERSSLVAKKSIAWARDSLIRLPVRLTLENVGVFALLLAFILPRSFVYLLIYPIFRLVFGTLYPAYASYKAVRTKNVKEYVKWMMYWIVFALFTCAETFTDVFFSFWFPFYYEIKIILVLWLLSPATKGSSILYRRFVHPALCRRETEIDEALARATEQGYTAVLQLGSKGVNYATTVLMQTAIKRGGGLVQQLRKSYSLSDLTGETEGENCNSRRSPDEVDLEEPRRRERSGRRGYSPRRTQSSSNRVEMCFSEMDGEPVCSLTNIKSSDDISSGYSSGEALKPKRSSIASERAVRHKPRMASKKPAEDEEYIGKLKVNKNQVIGSILHFLTAEENFQIRSYLSQLQDSKTMIEYKEEENLSSDEESLTLKVELPRNEERIEEQSLEVVIESEREKAKGEVDNDISTDTLNSQLKELMNSTSKSIASLVSCNDQNNWLMLNKYSSPNISRSSSDCTLSERAGRYHKKPAPKAPEKFNQNIEIDKEEKEDEDEEGEALKATLVIKRGSVKSFTNSEPVDTIEIKRRNKFQVKNSAREGFSKLLTIPKSMFHNAFHKEKHEFDKTTENNISFGNTTEKIVDKDKIKKSLDQETKYQILKEQENSSMDKTEADV